MGKRSESFWKRVNEYEKDEMRDRMSHSISYHNYFKGYSERKVPGKKGKGYRIERIYTADYYKYQESDPVWRMKKIFYLLLSVSAVIFIVAGGISNSDLNCLWFIGLAQVLACIPITYLGYTVFSQVQAARMMTIGEYNAASANLKAGALIAGIYMAIVSVVMILTKLFLLFHNSNNHNSNDTTAIAGELAGTALILLLYRLERERQTEVIKNNTPVPYDANEIW